MDINESFMRLKRPGKNVDFVVINKDNCIVRSSGDFSKQIINLVQIIDKCRAAFKENDELTFLKIRTKKCEYLVVPDKEYMLIALGAQNLEELNGGVSVC